QARALPVLRPRGGHERERHREHEEHALPRAPRRRARGHQRLYARRVAEARHRAPEPERAGDEERRHDQRHQRPEQKERLGELHGNLRSSHARSSASSAISATPGTSSSGKRSSYEAMLASNLVFSSWFRIWCMLSASALPSVAMKNSAEVL